MSSSRKTRKVIELAIKKNTENLGNQIKKVMQYFEKENYVLCDKKYTKKIKPLILIAENSDSIPLKIRLREKEIQSIKPFVSTSLGRNKNKFSFRSSLVEIKAEDGELEFIAFKYFSYIKKTRK